MKKLKVSLKELVESDIFGREALASVVTSEDESKPTEEVPESVEPKEIEDIVSDWQDKIGEAYDEVKSFKPGQKEALTFATYAEALSGIANQAAADITQYYKDKLGDQSEPPAEESEETSTE